MKQSELKKCALCGLGMMHAGVPIFYRVTLERFCVDVSALQRRHGLELMLSGNAVLAAVMGPNEDIAKSLDDNVTLLICMDCATKRACVALLHEAIPYQEAR